jgi:translation initiation factor 2B subunit (eIF-2B alpha/beta/delta family)
MEVALDPLQVSEILDGRPKDPPAISGHLFDRTPAEYIKAVVTERGIQHPNQVGHQMRSMPISESLISEW